MVENNPIENLKEMMDQTTVIKCYKEELEFLEEWYSICCYKSSFKDDCIEKRISQLKEAIKQGEKGK